MTAPALKLKSTPLNSIHRKLGGRMVEFGGWDMPVQYAAGTVEEHVRTRKHAGLFDVSHMGEVDVRGPDAVAFVNGLVSNDASKLVDEQAQYSALTTPEGTVIDDLLVYRFAEDHLLLVVNAGTTDKDWDWISSHRENEDIELRNVSDNYCQIALQGPDALGILQKLTRLPLSEVKYYHFREGEVDGVPAIVSRTGYTGEDGFEVYNTLRLEAGMCLYGHEIDETTTLLEANLGWITKLNKGYFIGRDRLLKQKEEGIGRKLLGFEVTDRGIARDGQDVLIDGQRVGQVTSGSPAPFLKKNIGMAYVPVEFANEGRAIEIDVRGRRVGAQIVPLPFYKRPKQ